MPSADFLLCMVIKGALCSYGKETQTQNFNIYNITDVKTQTTE